jgi:hypothetical protein
VSQLPSDLLGRQLAEEVDPKVPENHRFKLGIELNIIIEFVEYELYKNILMQAFDVNIGNTDTTENKTSDQYNEFYEQDNHDFLDWFAL